MHEEAALMFGRWNNMRRRSVEQALESGRLNEAWEIVAKHDLAREAKAADLHTRLADATLAQARVDILAGRYAEARAGLAQLDALAHLPEALRVQQAALLRRVDAQQARDHSAKRQDATAAAEARAHLEAGRVTAGARAAEQIQRPSARRAAQDAIDDRREQVSDAVESIEAALEQADLFTAARRCGSELERNPANREVRALGRRIAEDLAKQARSAVLEGRLSQLQSYNSAVDGLRECDPSAAGTVEELGRLVDAVQGRLARWDFAALRRTLLRLSAVAPAPWIDQALQATADATNAHERLLASPLGVLGASHAASTGDRTYSGPVSAHGTTVGTGPRGRTMPDDEIEAPENSRVIRLTDQPLLVLVDGTGSALLVRRDVLRLGRAGGSAQVEVPIPADVDSHHADIYARGDEHMLIAYGPTRVERRDIPRTRLADGMRVRLGERARFTYCKPSAMSETAILKLADRNRLPHDVSLVVLMRDTVLIGPNRTSHVQTRDGRSRVVLFERDGLLWGRRAGRDSESIALLWNTPTDFGDLRITVTDYPVGTDYAAGLA